MGKSMQVGDELYQRSKSIAESAKSASRHLAATTGAQRNAALHAIADSLLDSRSAVLNANAEDVAESRKAGVSEARLDRLRLDEERLQSMADGIREVAALPDPGGEVIEGGVRPNGLRVSKIRVPLGVVFFIYESRPNVTTDAAALCLKSGNAVILRGGSEAKFSNAVIGRTIVQSLERSGLPPGCVSLAVPDRESIDHFLSFGDLIDLAIPRGGEELIRRVVAAARMPVLKHYKGVCHVYLDASADFETAVKIVVNSKTQRPGVCNAAECLLVHASSAPALLPVVAAELTKRGVELRGCPRTLAILPNAKPAAADDFGREFLDLVMAVKVVDDLDAAMEHIRTYGTGHTECIVTQDWSQAQRFQREVDAAAVMVNASTRFNDGGELGLGAEIGISTDKFHARGPCGLRELTTTKWLVLGDGQVRK
jgi:glutamate-5-semialdehyde dehydrogenase